MAKSKTNTTQQRVHELKPEQGAGFKLCYETSTCAAPKIRVGAANREWLVRTDMQEAVKLTGQWRHDWHGYQLLINQAGPHIQMLLALVENGVSGTDADIPRDTVRSARRVVRLGGDVDPTDRTLYHIYLQHPNDPVTADLQCGTLQHFDAGKRLKLEFDLSGVGGDAPILAKLANLKSTVAIRFGFGPNLFENHVGQRWMPAEVRSQLWFPLTEEQIRKLPSFIYSARIKARADNFLRNSGGPEQEFGYLDLIRAYFVTAADPETSDTQKRQRLSNAAAVLDLLVRDAYWDALNRPATNGGIDVFHRDAFRVATLTQLANTRMKVVGQEVEKSLLTHTQTILDGPSSAGSLVNFEEILHLTHRLNGHYYAATLEFIDVDGTAKDVAKLEKIFKKYGRKIAAKIAKTLKRRLPAGGLLGMLEIKKQDDPDENAEADKQPPEWEGTYTVMLAGLSFSRSTGSGTAVIRSTGKAKHVYGQTWQPEQVEGLAMFTDLGVSIFGGGGGGGKSMTVLSCRGSGKAKPPTPLQLDFSGISDIFAVAPGASAVFSGFAGWLDYVSGKSFDDELEAPPENAPFSYGSHSKTGPLHFPINHAGLLGDGERLLQAFAATELALLSQPGVTLRIDGYADQPGDKFKNAILSRNRAITVYNYLKNILGDDLATTDLVMPPLEDEEFERMKEAARDGKTYKIEIPEHDQIIIAAHGEPAPAAGDKPAKPKYDQKYRRVDLSIDGMVKLGLRRTDDGLGH